MARVTIKIPWNYRTWLFAFIAVSWLTGVTFFVLNKWFTVEGMFGPEKHPWQFIFLKVHGASAFLMMISYGYLLATHIPAGYKSKRQRALGLGLVAAQAFLIITAYGLYYVGGQKFHELLSYAHASVGLVFPFLLLMHIISGKKK
ncbi:MAG: hypothetical protein ACSHX0_00595 [Akkermansiaceae bacterium]